MNFFKPMSTKNDSQNHEQMQECMVVLKEVATAAKSGNELRALDSLKHLMKMVTRSELPTTIRERFIEEGKKYALAVHRLKLQDYFDRAFNYTRSGDTANRELMIRNSLKCIEAMGHLTTNSQFIEEMLKRVDVLRQTSQAGTSDLAKTDNNESPMQNRQGAGKRRFLRYDSPVFWVKLPKESQPYRTLDYSMTGMLLDGIPPTVKEGSRVHVIVSIADEEVEKTFEGSITITRILTEKQATAISFVTAEGPVMFFIRNRLLDLSTKRPI